VAAKLLQQLGIGDEQLAHDPTVDTPFDDAIAQWLQNLGYNWQRLKACSRRRPTTPTPNPGQASFWVARALELTEDFQYFGQLLRRIRCRPSSGSSVGSCSTSTHILEVTSFLSENPALFVAFAPALTPLAAGAAGLAGLGALAQPVIPMLPLESVAVPALFRRRHRHPLSLRRR